MFSKSPYCRAYKRIQENLKTGKLPRKKTSIVSRKTRISELLYASKTTRKWGKSRGIHKNIDFFILSYDEGTLLLSVFMELLLLIIRLSSSVGIDYNGWWITTSRIDFPSISLYWKKIYERLRGSLRWQTFWFMPMLTWITGYLQSIVQHFFT